MRGLGLCLLQVNEMIHMSHQMCRGFSALMYMGKHFRDAV